MNLPVLPSPAPYTELKRHVLEAIDARLVVRQGLDALEAARGGTDRDPARRAVLRARANRARLIINASTLILVHGAIDAHIEILTGAMRDVVAQAHQAKRKELQQGIRERTREMKAQRPLVNPGTFALLDRFTWDVFRALLPPLPGAWKRQVPTTERWEDALRRVWMHARPDRPVPEDLRATLDEFGEVRNVLVHGMGRMDRKALALVAEGPWTEVGQVVEIDGDLYRRYIAALFAYLEDLPERVVIAGGGTAVTDLTSWRMRVPAGG